MLNIVTRAEAVTAFAPWMEPTDGELDAIEREMPVITAEIELLDAQITILDRPAGELDARRVRRALGRVLAARTAATNHTTAAASGMPGGAA